MFRPLTLSAESTPRTQIFAVEFVCKMEQKKKKAVAGKLEQGITLKSGWRDRLGNLHSRADRQDDVFSKTERWDDASLCRTGRQSDTTSRAALHHDVLSGTEKWHKKESRLLNEVLTLVW